MLPTAGPLPTGPQWAYEMKWDGVRIVAASDGGLLQMRTRHGNDILPSRFPELTGLVDTFSDIIVDGVDLRAQPYSERRAVLESLDLPQGWARTPVFQDGPATAAASIEHGLEGVVAKKLSSRYVSGRSRAWIKQRHSGVIDATVIGWVRRSSGGVSLLLAESTPDGWHYTGRVTAPRSLLDVLIPLAAATPAAAVPAQPGAVHWVRPQLLVEVTASSRAPDGRLRQARFVRARLDQLG